MPSGRTRNEISFTKDWRWPIMKQIPATPTLAWTTKRAKIMLLLVTSCSKSQSTILTPRSTTFAHKPEEIRNEKRQNRTRKISQKETCNHWKTISAPCSTISLNFQTFPHCLQQHQKIQTNTKVWSWAQVQLKNLCNARETAVLIWATLTHLSNSTSKSTNKPFRNTDNR